VTSSLGKEDQIKNTGDKQSNPWSWWFWWV